jgi:cytochrome c556
MRHSTFTDAELAKIAAECREQAAKTADAGVRAATDAKAAVFEELLDRRAEARRIEAAVTRILKQLDGTPEKLEALLS